MNIDEQKRLARAYGFNLCAEYKANNGAWVIPHTVWERDFDGALMVSYRASHKDIDGGMLAEGDTSLSSMSHWLGADRRGKTR